MDKDKETEIRRLILEEIKEFRKEEFYPSLKELEDNIKESNSELCNFTRKAVKDSEDSNKMTIDYLNGRISWVGAILFGLILILFYIK